MWAAAASASEYDFSTGMWSRPREIRSTASASAADPALTRSETVARAIARFVIDAYSLAREAADPQAALDEIFHMIEAAWKVTCPSASGHPGSDGPRPWV